MIIIGAKGHAKEVLQIIKQTNNWNELYFFDNLTINSPDLFLSKYRILKNFEEVKKIFLKDNRFILGIGSPFTRLKLCIEFKKMGGSLESIISPFAQIGDYDISLGIGLNIMTYSIIYNNVSIGEGSLINTACSIHHDVIVGKFCELSPGVRLLGNSKIGDYSQIGSNAVVLPNLEIGSNVIIGAGAVVTRNIPSNCMALGIPARVVKSIIPPSIE